MSLLTDIISNRENLYSGDLKHYFKCLFDSRGAGNPYHNIRHACTVLVRCYEGVKESSNYLSLHRLQNRWLQNWTDKDLFRGTLIAAIAHDQDHPGRAGNDDLNIELALRSLKKNLRKEDGPLFDFIQSLIKSTEFGPQGHIKIAETEYHKILRDADLTQICSDAWIRMILFGLSEEMGVAPLEMLRMQEGFLKNLRFESQWGQQFNPIIAQKIQEARDLLDILSDGDYEGKGDESEDDLEICEQCGKKAWNGRLCYLCGAKNRG